MYKNNNGNHDGRDYVSWYNTRGSTNQKLDNIPHITTITNGNKRYYSALDAEIYFGDIFVDEITNIIWTTQQQTLPIYGYNSYTFDDIAVGARLIQGQFTINFTTRNFLEKIQKDTEFKKVARRMYGKDNPSTTVYSDYREKLHLPKWDKGFDIVIGFGNNNRQDDLLYSTFLVIGCVQVNGSSLQLDQQGKPLTETYTFIARDVKDYLSGETEQDPASFATNFNSKDGSGTGEVIRSLKLNGSIDLSQNTNQLVITSDEVVSFNSGIVQFVDSFENKILSQTITLNPDDNDKNLIASLSTSFISAFKKECSKNSQIVGHVDYKYKKGTGSDTFKSESANVIFSIKKI